MNPQLKFWSYLPVKIEPITLLHLPCVSLMRCQYLLDLIPRDDQRNSKVSFDVKPAQADHAPSCSSRGVLGQMSGPEQMK